MFYESANDLLQSELPIGAQAQLYPIFESGARAYRELLSENLCLFNSVFFNNLRGQLFSYLIFRQFNPDMISQNFFFQVEAKKVNNFNYRALNLVGENLIVNVCRTIDSNSLPTKSKYRKTKCKLNKFNEKGLCLRCINDQLTVKNEPYYAFLTYGHKRGVLEFANIIIPNYSMTEILAKIDLKSELHLYKSQIHNSYEEEKVTTLKKETLEMLSLFKRNEGNGSETS